MDDGDEAGGFTRGSLAVVVRAAVITVPRIVRIIIRRVVSIIFRFGRANPITGVVSIGAAAKQKCKRRCADQRKDRYNVPTLFPFRCHAFGALISRDTFCKRKLKIKRIGAVGKMQPAPMR